VANLVHLGFAIPEYVTWKRGERYTYPGPGICVECGKPSGRTYARFDERPYCEDCIKFDLASAVINLAIEQRHPDIDPEEMVYDVMRLKGGSDDFELRAIAAGPHPDPRMYDRTLA
jgi:hypothetical protein